MYELHVHLDGSIRRETFLELAKYYNIDVTSDFGFKKVGNTFIKDFGLESKKKMGGRIRKMGGGSLKPVDPKTQKGLSKLPTKVRNKMGYMKKGGKVHGK